MKFFLTLPEIGFYNEVDADVGDHVGNDFRSDRHPGGAHAAILAGNAGCCRYRNHATITPDIASQKGGCSMPCRMNGPTP